MVGKQDMNLFGWKQLIEWSLEHACMNDEEYREARQKWEEQWDSFIKWILDEYRGMVRLLDTDG